MDTTTAATHAGVTVATIRTWCRIGAIAARKAAGRWTITAESLTYRISLGIRHTKKATPAIDLTTTYTCTLPGYGTQTVTPKIRDRARPEGRVVSISTLAPLLADHIDAITDPGDRGHTLIVLMGAIIALREDGAGLAGKPGTALDGRVATTYTGTPHLPIETVLALGERLHTQLI